MSQLRTTPFYENHQERGARFINFHGWHLPSHFPGGAVEEHLHTRSACGVFDVSHMGQIMIRGKGAAPFLETLVPSSLESLQTNQCKYTCLLNHTGGILDDLVISKISEDQWMLCVNGARQKRVLDWITENSSLASGECLIEDVSGAWALLAIQGPKSPYVLKGLCDDEGELARALNLSFYEFCSIEISGVKCVLSRTGYTAELGYELYLPSNEECCSHIYTLLMSHSYTRPAGLSARNTLRLEAGYLLYGSDITETSFPQQVGLSWLLSSKKDFLGKAAVEKYQTESTLSPKDTFKLYGFVMESKKIAREGMEVFSDDKEKRLLGRVTSGSYLPTLGYAGGYALVKNVFDTTSSIAINRRGELVRGKIVPLPFYPSNTKNEIKKT